MINNISYYNNLQSFSQRINLINDKMINEKAWISVVMPGYAQVMPLRLKIHIAIVETITFF